MAFIADTWYLDQKKPEPQKPELRQGMRVRLTTESFMTGREGFIVDPQMGDGTNALVQIDGCAYPMAFHRSVLQVIG